MPITDVSLEDGASITHPDLVDLAGCRIGAGARVGPFVQIRPGSRVGVRCKVSSHSVLGPAVELGEGVFVGHGVVIGDTETESRETGGSETVACRPTRIGPGASLGSRSTVLPGLVIGRGAMIGAGAVVTGDVPDFALVVGVPGRVVGDARDRRGLEPHDPAGRLDEVAAG